MSSERTDVWSANAPAVGAPAGAAPFAILGTDFVEVLALFVRTIPLYPDGHGRVVAVSDRLQDTAAVLSEPQVIEVADRGLIVNGKERAELPPGPAALRESLLATAVVRVIFQPTTPASSYVAFARSLQRNARVAGSAHLAFADLWMAPIPGIEVQELVFDAEGFVEGVDDSEHATDQIEVLGSVAGAGGGAGASIPASTGSGDEKGVDAAPVAAVVPPEKKKPRGVHTVARDLRELILEDPNLAAALIDLESRLVGSARTSRNGADVLEHLVRALPIEARLDSAKGLAIVRKVLNRILAQMPETPSIDASPDLATRFFQTLERVFPKRIRPIEDSPAPADLPDVKVKASPLDELLVLDDSVLDEWSGARDGPPAAIPELVDDDGIVDPSGVMFHAFLEEPPGARRDALRRALLATYAARSKTAPPPCVLKHLTEALAAKPRDAARVDCLGALVDAARLDYRPGTSPITFDVAVALFPRCLSTYVRAGGRAGAVARKLGREAVLAHASSYVAPGGLLTGENLDRVLSDRTFDILPFVEALLVGDAASRPRVVRALRVLDLKSLAAVALRVVPEARFTDRFLQGLCADGFAGVDSKHLLPEAAAALGSVVLDKEGVLDLKTRTYATAALGSFPAALAEAPLRAVAARKLIGAAPKEIRRAAEEILLRFARAAADARPVP